MELESFWVKPEALIYVLRFDFKHFDGFSVQRLVLVANFMHTFEDTLTTLGEIGDPATASDQIRYVSCLASTQMQLRIEALFMLIDKIFSDISCAPDIFTSWCQLRE
jgi:hypothetical protein